MSVYLADANVLIALTTVDHTHHASAIEWFLQAEPLLATCPITEGALLRFFVREGTPAAVALGVIESMRAQDWHVWWPDDVAFTPDVLPGVIGHRQVTDAYLVALARGHDAQLVTFDRGVAALHPSSVELLSASAL